MKIFNHDFIEQNSWLMIILIVLTVAVGGLVEIVPLYFQRQTTEPVAGVKPICLQPTVCEYLPPRKAGLAERYIVSIPDGSVAALSADEDRVVINPRQLALEKPATVDVTLEIPGQPPIVKRIVYGAAPVG